MTEQGAAPRDPPLQDCFDYDEPILRRKALMRTAHHRSAHPAFDDELMRGKRRRAVPHEFVLDALAPLSPVTRPMFGCVAVYVEEKIVLILRDKPPSPADNGVWIATTAEHHETLRREFPQMRSIQVFGKATTGWQVLAADAPDFEEAALRACELIRAGDERIGKIPKRRVTAKARARKTRRPAATPRRA
jgi:hypothetical protein